MRTTSWTTWLQLLLSLGFLLSGICTDSDGKEAKTPSTTKAKTTAAPPSDAGDVVTAISTTAAVTTVASNSKPATDADPAAPATPAASVNTDAATLAPTPTNLTAALTTILDAPTQATTQLTPVTTHAPPAQTKPDKTAAPPMTVPVNVTQPPVTASVVTPASTAGNTGALVVSRDVTAATRALGTVAPTSGTSKTEAPASTPTVASNIGTTQTPKVLTGAPPTSQKSSANTQATTRLSQGVSDPVIQKTTVPASQGHTTPASSQPAVSTLVPGIPSTTTTPTTPTTVIAGTSAAEAVTTKAEATPAKPAEPAKPATTTTTTSLRFTPTSGDSKAITDNKKNVQLRKFVLSLNNEQENEVDKKLAAVCKHLLVGLQDGNCTLTVHGLDNKLHFEEVEISGKVATTRAEEYYQELNKKPTDNKTLIAILASCGALLIMIVILAVCASHHRKPYSENQQHLTEELPTVENGYHDNPTLDVMEAQSEMQEKKSALNGEFIDSWIVPMENMKGDVPDEEDTHL